jgi:acyl-CoA synthetase (AMP-forming)/AMP-acid ligase II
VCKFHIEGYHQLTSFAENTLLHCLNIANAVAWVATPDLIEHLPATDDLKMVKTSIQLNIGSFDKVNPDERFISVSQADLNSTLVTVKTVSRTLRHIAALIYTSGTSGRPKAVSVKNWQLILTSTPTDLDVRNPKRYLPIRTYSCLPLFHATCLFTGLMYSAGNSGTFCLARKFTASGFSRALVESRATRMLYVGEICRYLLKAPPSPYDRAHECHVAVGNGLTKDVWTRFMDRFGIEEIREFYRSTEGIAKFDNWSRGVLGAGKIGFQGHLYRRLNKHTILIRYDTNTEAPWRDPKTGFCVPARLGEPGEAIGIVTNMDVYPEYLNNPKANEEKLIANVFKKGDLYQRMGDLLVNERSGWISFRDRTGDTYRWNGENVSAGEVREHIAHIPGVTDVTVHAVKLDGYDGQAGAAAITLVPSAQGQEDVFAEQLSLSLKKSGLAAYQLPRLIRFIEQ